MSPLILKQAKLVVCYSRVFFREHFIYFIWKSTRHARKIDFEEKSVATVELPQQPKI